MAALLAIAVVAVAVATSVEAESLTASTFDAAVKESGKAAFIKFQAPWWGHCKKMKPDWDTLMSEYADSSSVVVGDVDCTVEKDLCSDYDVRGYPTIKYFKEGGDPKGDSYNGGRDIDALRSWTEENLGSADGCDPATEEGCSDQEKAFIAKMKDADAATVTKQLTRLQGMMDGKMKPELKKWVRQRVAILKTLAE